MLKPVIQEESTGCGIAAAACILGKSYAQMKSQANAMGIHASDSSLWSDTHSVRRLLGSANVICDAQEQPFESWSELPDLALLAIKHHQKDGKNFWHWAVFCRTDTHMCVLDSASYLPSHIRTDFAAMQPKWFIGVQRNA